MKVSIVFGVVAISHFVAAETRRLQTGAIGRVTKFRLINANAGNKGQALIDPIVNGTIVKLQDYPLGQQFSVEAVTSTKFGPIGSVRFSFNNVNNFFTENKAPYAMCRDVGGAFKPCSQLIVGRYTIAATTFSRTNGAGTKGNSAAVSFSIVARSNPSPVAVPKAAPRSPPVEAPRPSPVAAPKSLPVVTPRSSPVRVPSSSNVAKWIEIDADAPVTKRHEACFVMVGRKAYLLTGRSRQVVDIYDPVRRTWSTGATPPIQIHHAQCVAVDDSIWIVSAWTGGFPRETNTDKIYIYNTTTNKWLTKEGLPENRRRGGAAAVLVGDKIYVSHGNRGGHETGNHSTTLGWLDYYDISEDRWHTDLADAPNPRDHTGGALVNGRVCVAGGRDGGDVNFFNKVILPTDCYDPKTNKWSVEANIPNGRGGSSYGTTCDGKLIVAGGEGGSKTASRQAWADVDVFDGSSWTSIDSLNVARHGSGLAVDCVCNQIYIASGAGTQGGRSELTSLETFFPNGVDVPCSAK